MNSIAEPLANVPFPQPVGNLPGNFSKISLIRHFARSIYSKVPMTDGSGEADKAHRIAAMPFSVINRWGRASR
jgi:hypothetical protein